MGFPLYVLGESDNDESFYANLAQIITDISFETIPIKLRKNGGALEVRKVLPAFINSLTAAKGYDNAYFIISIDNDRAPRHPEHEQPPNLPKSDSNKICLTALSNSILRKDSAIFEENGRLKALSPFR